MTALFVVAGAVVGAPLRLLALRSAVRLGWDPALGTLLVNVVGGAVLGAVLGAALAPSWVVALVGTGLSGTLTTFSTFGADVLRLAELHRLARAVGYVTLSLVLGLAATAFGSWVAR